MHLWLVDGEDSSDFMKWHGGEKGVLNHVEQSWIFGMFFIRFFKVKWRPKVFGVFIIVINPFSAKIDPVWYLWLTDGRCALFVCGSFDFHWLKYLIGNRFFLSNFVPKCTPILRSKNHWSLMCRKFKAVITLLMHTTSYLSSRKFLRNDIIIISKIHTYDIYNISYEVRISIF